jgi:AcrR family transcriptional regulator
MALSDGPSPRTQAQRRAESEAALLDAAAELIAERGIDRASLGSIGERAGSSRGLPTHHFGSKDALVARVARRAQDRVRSETAAALEQRQLDRDDVSTLEVLRITVDTYLDLYENASAEARALIVMWGATFPSDAAVEGMHDAQQDAYTGWADTIRAGQQDGSIRQDVDPAAAAVVLIGLMRGVAALLLTDSDLADMADVRSTCDQWVTQALAPVPRENDLRPVSDEDHEDAR